MKKYKDTFSLKGKTAVIVGGAGLIGAQMSQALAAHGARVIICDNNRQKAQALVKKIKAQRGKVQFEALDVTDLENLEERIKVGIFMSHNDAK